MLCNLCTLGDDSVLPLSVKKFVLPERRSGAVGGIIGGVLFFLLILVVVVVVVVVDVDGGGGDGDGGVKCAFAASSCNYRSLLEGKEQ